MLIEYRLAIATLFAFSPILGGPFYFVMPPKSGRYQERIGRWLIAATLLSFFGGLTAWFFSGQIYVVYGRDNYKIYRAFGPAVLHLPNGEAVEVSWQFLPFDPYSIVNKSHHLLVVECVPYGDAVPDPPVLLPAYSKIAVKKQIYGFFEKRPPPDKIEVDQSVTGGTRLWLRVVPLDMDEG